MNNNRIGQQIRPNNQRSRLANKYFGINNPKRKEIVGIAPDRKGHEDNTETKTRISQCRKAPSTPIYHILYNPSIGPPRGNNQIDPISSVDKPVNSRITSIGVPLAFKRLAISKALDVAPSARPSARPSA